MIIFIVSSTGTLVKRFSASSGAVMHLWDGGGRFEDLYEVGGRFNAIVAFGVWLYFIINSFCYIVCRSRDLRDYWSEEISWFVNFDFSIYEVHTISFQTFFVWALLLILYTWNSSPLRSNLPRLQCTCCTVSTTSGRLHGSPLVWACQWPSLQPLSSPQLSHNDSLWA